MKTQTRKNDFQPYLNATSVCLNIDSDETVFSQTGPDIPKCMILITSYFCYISIALHCVHIVLALGTRKTALQCMLECILYKI